MAWDLTPGCAQLAVAADAAVDGGGPGDSFSGVADHELIGLVCAFDQLEARFPADRYDVRRMGDDPRFPYDTYGSVDDNARSLTEQIRHVSANYSGVDIVSHSMGGVVVDRALAGGLSSDDGVVTYVAIAGPHSGADFARAPAFVLPIISPVKEIVRAGGVAAARDPESTAINDLATARPIRPPAGNRKPAVRLGTKAGLRGTTRVPSC